MYAAAVLPVRPTIREVHEEVLESLASPGRWLTSGQRVQIAREVRSAPTCVLCAARKAALSPYAVDGEHSDSGPLSAAHVDVVHRAVTDPARLTQAWLDGLGLAPDVYIECLGVAVKIVGMDTYARGIGAPVAGLPEPGSGEPSGERVVGARDEGAWIPSVPARGIPNVGRALSLAPEENRLVARLSKAHYVPPRHVPNMGYDPGRAISRTQMELVAGRVSKLNGCFY